ncbi:ATP-binding protein [Clostridium sp. D2Q-11]|uniref:histidine kinase n=1 Tax=Anaeromonas frigoriresistens TaxID=2683708 RepID=A0A942Z7E9_9FIRM|nr:ATP-binding protein [Anaeromonas frigoriresistens]MBS4537188.1 ATP-binding protein [Anaeromonas frigoriresistens]
MKELSLHILDIIQNSIVAKATMINVDISEDIKNNKFSIGIKDNGIGIKKNILNDVLNPFVTTRKTRKVGLGLSLFKATAERCRGKLILNSKENVGTEIYVEMEYNNIDRPPLGSIEDTLISILSGEGNEIDIEYTHNVNGNIFTFDTVEIKKMIDGVEITSPEIILWLKDYIKENIRELY